MRIAILHDYLNQMGGAENVLHTLHEIFPQAPIYTSFYRPEAMPPAFREFDIRTTFLQKFGPLRAIPVTRSYSRSIRWLSSILTSANSTSS